MDKDVIEAAKTVWDGITILFDAVVRSSRRKPGESRDPSSDTVRGAMGPRFREDDSENL